MKRICIALALMLSMAAPAFAVDFAFHGDLNNRSRVATNQAGFYNGYDKSTTFTRNPANQARSSQINDDTSSDSMVDMKYRLWTEISSDEGGIKGVYAIELAQEFGGAAGADFGGDDNNIMTRWAYTDFALGDGRMKVGLMGMSVNKYFWQETATGINYKVDAGQGNLELAWYRPYEVVNDDGGNDFEDLDALYARYNLKPNSDTTIGFFGVWQHSDGKTTTDPTNPAQDITDWYLKYSYSQGTVGAADIDLYTLGIDGGTKSGDFFANWDVMFQTGDYAEAYDFGGYFAHFDVGMNMGKGKLTYTFWYASGDDERGDTDYDAFIATDVDLFETVVFFEGYTDSDYFSAVPYLQDKGMIFNRIKYDHTMTDKLKVGAAAIYMMTAEDLEYDAAGNGANDGIYSDDEIGLELDAYVSYQLFSNTEFAVAAGYLMTGDVMDFYEEDLDGSADEDIWMVESRLRYKF